MKPTRGLVINGVLIRITAKAKDDRLEDFLTSNLVPRKRITKEWTNEIPPGIH
jgi:hypothetical protein